MVEHQKLKTYGLTPAQMATMAARDRPATPVQSRSTNFVPKASSSSISAISRASSISSSTITSLQQRSLSLSDRPAGEGAILHMGAVTHTFEASLFSKFKKDYCILTSKELLHFKTSQKASQSFDFTLMKRRPNVKISSSHHMLSINGVIGVHYVPQNTTSFRIEHIDPITKKLTSVIIFTALQQDTIGWVNALRRLIQQDLSTHSPMSATDRSLVIERMQKQKDTHASTEDMQIRRVVMKQQRAKPTPDNPHASKEIILPVIFAIGRNSMYVLPHIIADEEYKKIVIRDRHGLLAIQNITYSGRDDTFELTIRHVASDSKKLVFVSSFCENIVKELRQAISNLVPFYPTPPYSLNVANVVHSLRVEPTIDISALGDRGFDALLEAYCASLNLDKRRFSFSISSIPDAPGARSITVHSPNEINESPAVYSKYELLAVFRALRHNVAFREISLANVDLHPLEQWPARAEDGWTNSLEGGAGIDNVLSSEFWSLFMHNKKLRKIDFTNCGIGRCGGSKSALHVIGQTMQSQQIGINAIHISKNHMFEQDVEALVIGMHKNRKALKELAVRHCDLSRIQLERIVECILEALPAHLRYLDLSHNYTYFREDLLSSMLKRCNHLNALKMRKCNVLTDFNALTCLRIRDLDIGRIGLTDHQVHTLCNWIESPAFDHIGKLSIDSCGLKSRHLNAIFQAIANTGNPNVELYVGANPLMSEQGSLGSLWNTIAEGRGPVTLSLANTEWEDAVLHELFASLVNNRTIKTLDLSGITMTTPASDGTIHALSSLFEQNRTLEDINLGGGLNTQGLGPVIAGAFAGLTTNTRLRCLRLENLGMGSEGAIALHQALESNRTLQELHVDQNNLSVQGFVAILKLVQSMGSIINLPRPNIDLRTEQKRLDALVRALLESQSESQFLLLYSTGGDAKRAKAHFDMQTTARTASERDRRQIGMVVDDIMKTVAQNKQRWQAQQAITIARDMSIAPSLGGLSPISIPSARERSEGSKLSSFAGSRVSQMSNMTGSDLHDSPNALSPMTPLTPKPAWQSPTDGRYRKALDRDDMEPLALGQAYLDAVDAYTSIVQSDFRGS
ncbi:hypothetical protein INT43_002950 [Umbelopsis isabellina]|uniref:PH domain-containing protein n=1 Tax=Mortierella isabellina TaxID=91625 RepID=A0A8H7PCG1_MORIS|nr:hypothetical protein INT43_002950 [Umbelopsis isabellina]